MDRVEEHTDHHHDWSNSNVGWMRQDDTESQQDIFWTTS